MGDRVVIIGCEILTALGNLEESWNGFTAGLSGLAPFAVDGLAEAYPTGRVRELDGGPGSPRRLHSLLERLFSTRVLGRDILQAGELIVATTKGSADELLVPENDKLEAQCWQVGAVACRISGCRETVQTVSAACASGTIALIEAVHRIISGESEVVTVVGLDLVSTFVTAGFAGLQALSPQGCRPFDRNRDGLSLGEGAGFITLCSETYSAKTGQTPLAVVEGWGVACDAAHITAPCRNASGLKEAIRQATGNGSIPIGAINAHGTGTIYNDAMEITAFRELPGAPPLHSVKGAIGHTLGAAGVIESAIAVRSLQEGCIPPTIGFTGSDDMNCTISGTDPLPLAGPTILACNSGFGGINAGILFRRPGS